MNTKQFVINVNEKDPDFAKHIKRRLIAAQNGENLITLEDLKQRLASHHKKLTHAKV